MVELAPVEGGLYAQGFAGDTLNTCWYLKRLFGDGRRASYLTRVGGDPLSARLLTFLAEAGIDATRRLAGPERTLGLYSSAWRARSGGSPTGATSAARRLADDPARLDEALERRRANSRFRHHTGDHQGEGPANC